MNKTRLLFTLFLCNTFLSVSSYAINDTESLDRIAAIVNDDVITMSELSHGLNLAKTQMTQEGVTLPPTTVLHDQVLNQLINKKVQLQLAKQAGISISDEYLNKTIQSIAQQNQMSVDALYERLHHEGMSTNDYRNEMRTQLTLHKLQQQEVVNRVIISPDEITSFLHSKVWRNNGEKEFHIEDMLIPLPDSPSADEIAAARKRAGDVLVKLRQGQGFHDVAQTESGSSPALQSGDLGWRKLPEIPSAFADQVVRMHANDIANPIQTPNGFHIIRLIAVRTLDAKQAEQSRKQAEEILLQRKFEEAVQTWVSRIRSQAYIVINPDKQ